MLNFGRPIVKCTPKQLLSHVQCSPVPANSRHTNAPPPSQLDDRLRRNTKDDNPGMHQAIQNKKNEILAQLRAATASQSSLEAKLRQGKTMGKAMKGSKGKSMKSKIF